MQPALLFDLDGTLVDSITLIVESMRHAFREREGAPSNEEWIAHIGTPLAACFRHYARDEDDVQLLIAGYREYQLANHDRLVRAYEAVPETLRALRERGYPLAVVTSKGEELAHRALKHVGIDDLFETVVGLESSTKHKPDPEPVHVALDRLGATPERGWFVGDSPHDINAGNSAGVTTVAALWGPFSRETLAAAGPSHIIGDIRELPGLLG